MVRFLSTLMVVLCAFTYAAYGRGPVRDIKADTPAETSSPKNVVQARAEETFQSVIDGLFEGDFGLYRKYFAPVMKKAQPRDTFLQLQKTIQKKLGAFRSMQYLGYYEQHGNVITLFKARFAKETSDVLVKLVLDAKSSDARITGLWFDSPALAEGR